MFQFVLTGIQVPLLARRFAKWSVLSSSVVVHRFEPTAVPWSSLMSTIVSCLAFRFQPYALCLCRYPPASAVVFLSCKSP